MKFFHLSDLHIGLRLNSRDLTEDQTYILRQIAEAAGREQPQVILIAGDIYDKAIPSAEAMDLFDAFVSELRAAAPEAEIMMISGNHDSASRVNVFRSVLAKQKIRMIGMPPRTPEEHIEKVILEDENGPVNFWLLPFVKPSSVKLILGTDEEGRNLSYDETLHRLIRREEIDGTQRNVLVSHQFYVPEGMTGDSVERMDSEIRTVGNIDSVSGDILQIFDYAALGHIHKPMKVGGDFFRYCGTPMACSVSEAGQSKGILVVEMGAKGEQTVRTIPLIPQRQVRVITGTLEEVLQQACDDYVTVILTDKEDLEVFGMQSRLRTAFPNLLEIRRENVAGVNYQAAFSGDREMDIYELCSSFLGEISPEEGELLQDVINTLQGGGK